MTESSIERLGSRFLCLVFLVVALSACGTVSKDWKLEKEQGDLRYYTRLGPTASMPEFKATVEVDAPVDEVMKFIMDFSRHTEWVHGCEQSSIIAMEDFSTAYIYQVTKLPVVTGRDMIMLAKITRDDQSKQVAVRLTAMPRFCDDNLDSQCAQTRNTHFVRVEHASGVFLLTPKGAKTHIEWTQFIDPAGLLPDWLVRVNLSQVPIKSLRQLKKSIESGDS